MKIEKLCIGGWYQRTMLHLTEIYDFMRYKTSHLDLEIDKLESLHAELGIETVDYNVAGLEYIEVTTDKQLTIRIFEDGLITLNINNIEDTNLKHNINKIADYYENKLSPAISYLFSLGAPIPKELANIQTIYPYFIVFNNETKENMYKLLSEVDRQRYFEFYSDAVDVIRGNSYYFINNKTKKVDQIDRFIEEQIFFREFKGQLHRYLNLHRTIWEKIADVKEKSRVKGKDIVTFTSKIDLYNKTINLVDSRINQMGTYLRTREKIAKNDESLKQFNEIIEYRYETLADTLSYIQQVWSMTKNYVNSAKSLFNSIGQEVTTKSVNNLTIVTSMGVGASLLGLFTSTEMPTITIFGIGYFLALAFIGFTVNKIMKLIGANSKYSVSDVDYDKDIK